LTPDVVTFVGHSTVSLELDGLRLLTDPLLRPRFLHARRQVQAPDPRVLDSLDVLLVSHLHQDHLDFPSIKRLDRGVRVIAPVGGARLMRRRGFTDVTELAPGERTRAGSLQVTATDAEHDGRRYPWGAHVPALGYDVRSPSSRVYFAGDTDLFDGMADMGGDVDVALLPIGGWGPKVGEGHLDGAGAARAAALIRPRIVVPIHWGTYLRMDLERRRRDLLTEPPLLLAAELQRLAPDVALRVLEPGASLEIPSRDDPARA
jgi:L-ascorbate metabolism protein UlaG (beta-lactamase superfamily)